MPSRPCSLASGLALPTPHKGCRLPVPAVRCRLQPGDDLLSRLGMHSVQCPALQEALDGFGHIEPGSAQRGKERNDAVLEQPEDEGHRVVPGRVVPDQQHPERGRILRKGDPDRESLLPALPATAVLLGRQHPRFRQARSGFFRCGIRVGDRHGPALALADRGSCLAPATIPIPGEPGIVENAPDGVGAHSWQPVRCPAERAVEGRERPGGRLVPVRCPPHFPQDALLLGPRVALGLPPPCPVCEGCEPLPIEASNQLPDGVATPPATARSALARATMAAGSAWVRLTRSRSWRCWAVRGRSGSFWRRVTRRLHGRGCSRVIPITSKWQSATQ